MIKDSHVIEQKTFKSLLSSFIVFFFFGGKLSMISCFCATALKGLVMIVSGKKVFSNQQTWQDVDGGGGHMWTYLAPTTITISTNVTHPTLNFPHYSSTNTLPTAISKPIQSWAAKIFRFNDLRRRCETLSGSQMSSLISRRDATVISNLNFSKNISSLHRRKYLTSEWLMGMTEGEISELFVIQIGVDLITTS